MSFQANYFIIDDFLLKKLCSLKNDALYEKIEYMLDNDDLYPFCDIDNIYQGLYFLISSKTEPIYDKTNFIDYAKSVFIFGDISLKTDEFISYIKKEDVETIIKEIDKINFNQLIFEPKVFDKNKIYPNIWLKEDKDLLLEELEMAFDQLKAFFKRAKKENKNILITII